MKCSSRVVHLLWLLLPLAGAPLAQSVGDLDPLVRGCPFVYVDDDHGPATPGWLLCKFDSIQDGVDAVSVGGTVYVQDGVYVEDVVIDKRLRLLGASEHVARVEGAGGPSVFTVSADGVTIEGFHVSHPSPERTLLLLSSFNTFRDNLNPGMNGSVRIEDGANDNVIEGNTLISFLSIGSAAVGSAGSHRNLIRYNGIRAIGLARSTFNEIRSNTIDSTTDGIELYHSNDNLIADNSIQSVYRGIELDTSHRNVISANDLTGSVYDGIRLDDSDSCSIEANTIAGQARLQGIALYYSDDVHVEDNDYLGSSDDTGLGVLLYQCENATLLDNTFVTGGISLGTYAEGLQYWNSHQIAGNTLGGRPIYYHVGTADLATAPDAAQVILVGCDRASVSGSTFSNAFSGIQLAYSPEATITGNTLFESGIRAGWSDALSIEENVLQGGNTAIELSGTGHTVRANRIEGASLGIHLSAAYGTLTANDIRFGDVAMLLDEATDNELSGNTLFGNVRGLVMGNGCTGNLVQQNHIEGNQLFGVELTGDAQDNTLSRNTILCSDVGVRVAAAENHVTENGIAGNQLGIAVVYTGSAPSSIFHNVLANAQNASDPGAHAWDDGAVSGGNYWDDYTGVDLDGDGLGDTPYPVPGGASVDAYPLIDVRGPGMLWPEVVTLPAGTGGTLALELHAGSKHAGRAYVLLGSMTGTEPGIPLAGGAVLPLVWDGFTSLVVDNLGPPHFVDFAGLLDSSGSGTATLDADPLDPGWIGHRLFFAYALALPWDFASWPVSISIVE